jgi:phenylacetate-CoA ligase
MQQLLDPILLIKIAKSYLSELNRIWTLNEQQLADYKDKTFNKMVKYAFDNVPLYHQKYKQHNIDINDINGIKDIAKLPFITKDDLRNNYPNGIIPSNFNINKNYSLSTSGSTGKPVFIFNDRLSAIKSLEAFIRTLKTYGGSWNKTRILLVIDLEPGSIEATLFSKSLAPLLQKLFFINNIRYLHIGRKPKDLIEEIDQFQPEFLGSDPNMLRKFANLRLSGYGKNIKPKYVFSSGAMLDEYTRNYIENAFSSRVVDLYGTTEAGPLGFECINKGLYHIHSDFIHLEFLNEKNQLVEYGQPGRLIVTKLYGLGTPIIRYTGIEDYVTPINIDSKCNLKTQMIKDINGRMTDLIMLPDGKLLSPLTVTGIPAKVMEKHNSYKIKQFQIIQQDRNNIDVLIVIDPKMRDKGVSVEDLFRDMKKQFEERIGNKINININEVDSIQKDNRLDYVQVVISKVKK